MIKKNLLLLLILFSLFLQNVATQEIDINPLCSTHQAQHKISKCPYADKNESSVFSTRMFYKCPSCDSYALRIECTGNEYNRDSALHLIPDYGQWCWAVRVHVYHNSECWGCGYKALDGHHCYSNHPNPWCGHYPEYFCCDYQ
jgi:hypothetical protein